MSDRLTEQEAALRMADMLDQMMRDGSQHVNLRVEDPAGQAQVKTTKSNDCGEGNLACRSPNLRLDIEAERTGGK